MHDEEILKEYIQCIIVHTYMHTYIHTYIHALEETVACHCLWSSCVCVESLIDDVHNLTLTQCYLMYNHAMYYLAETITLTKANNVINAREGCRLVLTCLLGQGGQVEWEKHGDVIEISSVTTFEVCFVCLFVIVEFTLSVNVFARRMVSSTVLS